MLQRWAGETFGRRLSQYTYRFLVFAGGVEIKAITGSPGWGSKVTTVGLAIAVVTVVAGCGGSFATSGWTSGSAVLDDLNDAGIACPWQASSEQVTPFAAADGDGFVVHCDDFSIAVVDSVGTGDTVPDAPDADAEQ